ncbi:MAG: D-2-hydroxyacid dehydrogenase [Anaerolineae bacterium]|nr:D-2-hydroxyacid dehydrogenase [Anaerolineae bacterium]
MKVLIGPNQVHAEEAIPTLQDKYPQIEFAYCADRGRIATEIVDADVFVGGLTPDALRAARELKWFASTSTGVDRYVSMPELRESDIILTNARGVHGGCLAESAFGMILAFTRGIREAIYYQTRGEWAPRGLRGKLVELKGATMGIIGFGTVGQAMAHLAQAHGMRILAVDLYPAHHPDHVSEVWPVQRLNDMLRVADYVVVTVPYTPQTANMIGEEQLALLKPSAMLVGMSRGGIIDQVALARALREGRLAAAALDVFDPEPLPPDSELWGVPNLLITPHIAGGTQYEHEYFVEILDDNLGRFLRGERPLRNEVDKEAGF